MDSRARITCTRLINEAVNSQIAVEVGKAKDKPVLARDLPTGRKCGGLASDVRGELGGGRFHGFISPSRFTRLVKNQSRSALYADLDNGNVRPLVKVELLNADSHAVRVKTHRHVKLKIRRDRHALRRSKYKGKQACCRID